MATKYGYIWLQYVDIYIYIYIEWCFSIPIHRMMCRYQYIYIYIYRTVFFPYRWWHINRIYTCIYMYMHTHRYISATQINDISGISMGYKWEMMAHQIWANGNKMLDRSCCYPQIRWLELIRTFPKIRTFEVCEVQIVVNGHWCMTWRTLGWLWYVIIIMIVSYIIIIYHM